MKIEGAELARLTGMCFDLSMDGRMREADRREFLALGKRLRGSLLNLLTAQFAEGTQAVVDANGKIAQINRGLDNATQALSNTAKTIGQIGELILILDDLLKVASAFV